MEELRVAFFDVTFDRGRILIVFWKVEDYFFGSFTLRGRFFEMEAFVVRR